jgi:hypothetical protein
MPLELPEPVTRPEVPAKEYPFMWLYNVHIHAPGPQHEATSRTEVIPMAADGDLLWSAAFTIETSEFMLALAEVPELAAAYEATLAAILPVKAWIEARQSPQEQPEDGNEENE